LLVVMAVTTMSLLVKLTYISKRCWDSLVKQKNSKSTFTNPVETHTELKQHLIRLMGLFYERDNIKFIWNQDLLYKIFSKHFNLNHTKHFDNTYHWIIYILFYIIQHQHKTRTNVSYWLSWSHHFERFAVATMAWLTVMEYLCHEYVPLVVSTSRSFPHSCLITVFVARLTRRVPLVEQELLPFPEHLSSSPVLSGVRVTRSLVLCVCFVDQWLSFCTFSFGHCAVELRIVITPLVSSNSSFNLKMFLYGCTVFCFL
jgi:hypothetical protein